ncbi:hypothetical protein [Cronobacter sakazakii]|uniref:hypothetical protein n=1 Tax=Cronobacter sakazakii TaxID=28141 RepID=UPI000CFD4AC5|nr:hypothetical protein [Cronobacter sakazakii]
MRKHVYITGMVLSMACAVTSVQASTLTESLSRCDANFFQEMYNQKSKLNVLAPLAIGEHHLAWFKGPADDNGRIWFTQPLKELNLTISGYYLQTSDLEDINDGKFYYWGMILQNSPQEVMKALNHLKWVKAGDYFITQAMIKEGPDSNWKINNQAVSGIAPAKESTEKILILSEDKNGALLLCSIQGYVTPDMLAEFRPDLKGKN